MSFKGWTIVIALLTSAISAQAAQEECVPSSDMQEIAASFPQFNDLASKGDYCFDGSPTSRLLSGIMFMRKTHFATQMPVSGDGLFSGTFANNWWTYFIGRINEFDVQANCQKGVVAYVYFFGNTMYVCPAALTENFTSLDLASVFMHEARHIDGFPHTTCSHGPRQGLNGACDERISDGGSYAVTVETYAQLAKYGDELHPALRAYARSASVIYADEAFEETVEIKRQQQFLLMTADKKLHRMFENQLTPMGSTPAVGKVVMRAQHMVLFPTDKTLTAEYLFAKDAGKIQQQAGDLAGEYNAQTPEGRAELVDIHIGAQWTARLTADKIRFTCNPRSAETSEMAIPNGEKASSLIYPTGYDRAARLVNVMTQSGHVLEMGCDQNLRGFVRTSSLQLDRPYKRIYKAGDKVVGLTNEGTLFEIHGTTSTEIVMENVSGSIVELIPNQNVEFFD